MRCSIRCVRRLILILISIVLLIIYYANFKFIYDNTALAYTNYDDIVDSDDVFPTLSTKALSSAILKIQEKQMFRIIHTSFLPETRDQLVLIRLRLGELIKKYAQWKYEDKSLFRNFVLTLRYYEFTAQNLEGNEVFTVTFLLKSEVNISSDAVILCEQFKSIFITNVSAMNNIKQPILHYALPSPDTDVINEQITVPARFFMSNSCSYRFMLELTQLEVNHTVKMFLTWPDWPLSTSCLMEIMRDLSSNNSHYLFNVTPLDYRCTETDILVFSSMHSRFVRERTAIAHWLDIKNEASDVRSILFRMQKRTKKRTTNSPTYRRSLPFEKSLDASVCPTTFKKWIANYQEWHFNTSRMFMQLKFNYIAIKDYILENNIRFLLYQKTSDDHEVTDRIFHLISTYLIAVLTRRFFVIDPLWSELERVYRISLNILPNNVAPWLPRMVHLNQVKNLTSSNTTAYTKDGDYDAQFSEYIVTMDRYTNNVIHTIFSTTGIYSEFLKDKLGMTSENIVGCLYHSLLIPRLENIIQMTLKNKTNKTENDQLGYTYDEILQILTSRHFHSIGLQIRADENSVSAASSSYDDPTVDLQLIQKYDHFFSCAHERVNSYNEKSLVQPVVIFLISDDIRLRQTALRQWESPQICLKETLLFCKMFGPSRKLLATMHLLEHSAHAKDPLHALRNDMMETFLFSICEEHIVSFARGVERIPAFTTLNFRNVYTVEDRNRSSCSNENNETKPNTSAHHYSEIR